jgi:hypothetical protein
VEHLQGIPRRLAEAIGARLGEVPGEAARARLATRLGESLRPRGGADGPPVLTWRLCEGLGMAPEAADGLGAAACFFYAAADLADDLADGEPGLDAVQGPGDVHRLLFLQQRALAGLPGVAPERRLALSAAFARGGLVMCAGQERDLAGTERPEGVDALAIARGKAGGELALLLSAPALALGRDPGPWEGFGEAYGALIQVFSDYADLFGGEQSRDWLAGKPTLPLLAALGEARTAPRMRELLAGSRGRLGRLAGARALALEAGAVEALEALAGRSLARMDAALEALEGPTLEGPPLLPALRVELGAAVADALAGLRARPPRRRPPPDPRRRVRQALEAGRRFVLADPKLSEAHEVNRWGMFGRAEVRGDLFGPLIVCELLAGHRRGPLAGWPLEGAVQRALSAADEDGWRYYPGHPEIPPDADDTGLALQLAARLGRGALPAVRVGEAALLANMDAEGLLPTWLCDGARYRREAVARQWIEAFCPAVSANALLGLWRLDRARHGAAVLRGARALAARLVHDAPRSVSYSPALVDFWSLRALLEIRAGSGERELDAGVAAAVARARGRLGLSGGAGGALETAATVIALCGAGALDHHGAAAVYLADAQEADGGWPADPFWVTVPAPDPRTFGSRLLTAALALRALATLRPGAPPAAGAGAGPISAGC